MIKIACLSFRGVRNSSFLLVLLFALVGCNLPGGRSAQNATLSVTQAYQTVSARLTQAIALYTEPPLSTSSLNSTDTGVLITTPSPSVAAGIASQSPPAISVTPTAICNLAAAGNPIDVTIPDDMQINPGQAFTKTWRLQNIGVCTWKKGYMLAYFSGELMGAPANVSLPFEVAPGQTVDVSIDLVAPVPSGTYQGNWKLRSVGESGSSGGDWFGIGPQGNSPFWVRITVLALSTQTATPGTPTPSPTATVSPVLQVRGPASLSPGNKLDLDLNRVDNGGEDLSYEKLSDGQHTLIPLGNTMYYIFGSDQPSLTDCRQGVLSNTPLVVESQPQGTYLCYRTGMGLPGWMLLLKINPDNGVLSAEVLTWSVP